MLGDVLRLSPLHDDRRRDGWSRQKPSPKSYALCYINSWLIQWEVYYGDPWRSYSSSWTLCLNTSWVCSFSWPRDQLLGVLFAHLVGCTYLWLLSRTHTKKTIIWASLIVTTTQMQQHFAWTFTPLISSTRHFTLIHFTSQPLFYLH